MSKRFLIAVLAAITIVSVCACGNQNSANEHEHVHEHDNDVTGEAVPVKKETKEEIASLAEAALEKLAAVPEYPEGYPTLEDVVDMYHKANMAVGWLVNTEPVVTDPTDTIEKNKLVYERVRPQTYLGIHSLSHHTQEFENAEGLIYNLETLEAYYRTLMTEQDAADYILDITYSYDVPKFIEDERGALYALPYHYEPQGYGDEDTYELVANDDGSYTFVVKYEYLDGKGKVEGEAEHHMLFKKNDDGRWVFERFIVIKQN